MMPRLPAYVPATYMGGTAGDVRVIWPSPIDNSAVLKPGTYTVAGRVPGTLFEAKATVIVKASGRHDHAAGPAGGSVHAESGRARSRRAGTRHAVHQESRQVPSRSRGLESGQLPLQLQGGVRSAATGRHQTTRRVGQPDDEAARACERPLPDGDRAGVCEHRVRPGAAEELPPEDELPGGHAVRPVAEVGPARAARRTVSGRSDRGARRARTARATTRI